MFDYHRKNGYIVGIIRANCDELCSFFYAKMYMEVGWMLPEDLRLLIFERLEKYSVSDQSNIVRIFTESLEVSQYELSVSSSDVSKSICTTNELYGEIPGSTTTEWNYG